jgi:hypothetical protein
MAVFIGNDEQFFNALEELASRGGTSGALADEALKRLGGKPSSQKCAICNGKHDNDVLTDICIDCEARINTDGSP